MNVVRIILKLFFLNKIIPFIVSNRSGNFSLNSIPSGGLITNINKKESRNQLVTLKLESSERKKEKK